MTEKPEILFLSHRIPYPPDKGDKIRSWRLFSHLTKLFRVHLACFVDDERDFRHKEFLASCCASAVFVPLRPHIARIKSLPSLLSGEALTFSYYRDKEMAAAVDEIRKRSLAAEIAFSSSMAPYIAAPAAARARIVDFCDADSEKWRQYAEETPGPLGWIYKREGMTLARAETRIANWADASFAVTPGEAEIFNQRSDIGVKVDWWSNGVDTEYFDPSRPSDRRGKSFDVVFTGAMDYRANVDAVSEFVRYTWPKVRKETPEASFAVVGANPVAKIRALNGVDGVTVTGRVDDVRPWLARAKIVVAPLRVARGVQNKVLEAMAMAKPVVATPEASTGINCTDDALCVVAGPTAMARAITALLTAPERRRQIGEAARASVVRDYAWDDRLKRFDAALVRLGVYSSASSSPSQSSRPSLFAAK